MSSAPAIGQRMRTLREATGHTRAYVAHKMHVSHSTVAMWELGRRNPTFGTVEEFFRAIGMSVHITPEKVDR